MIALKCSLSLAASPYRVIVPSVFPQVKIPYLPPARRAIFGCCSCALLLMGVCPAEAQNFPPIVRATTGSEEVSLGQPANFSSAETLDPDEGPQALSFLWDFGDGTTSSAANPSHSYAEPRAYRVTLTASDGADSRDDIIVVHVLAPPTALPPGKSSMLALHPAESELWVANPDSDSVSVLTITPAGLTKVAEIAVGKNPRTVAFSPNGSRVYVTCQDSNELWMVEAATRGVARKIAVGHRPYGVAVAATNGRIVVSNEGDGTVSVLTPELIVQKVIPVAATPRAVAVTADGGRAYVTHFLTRGASGTVTELDLASLTTSSTVPLALDTNPDLTSSGGGFPNLLSALTIDPAGRGAWFGGHKANTGRGIFVNDEMPHPENATRGFFGKVRLPAAREDVARRIDANDTDSVSAIAFSPNGRWAFVTHQGAGRLSVYDISAATLLAPSGDGTTIEFAARIDVGHAPQGVVVSADGRRGYVANYLSRNVQVLDLSNPRQPAVIATVAVTAEPLPASIANGKRLFYRSQEPMASLSNYISCAGCHPDGGGHDGRTWDFTNRGEGLRNTTDLRGRGGLADGPVHWSGNFDELQDFENDIVKHFGGTGLAQDGQPPHPPLGTPNAGRSANLDDLAAYVSSLTTPVRSPFRQDDGTLTVAARRGKALFLSPAVGCAMCHSGPRFTDSTLAGGPANFIRHNVGTFGPGSGMRLSGPLDGLDTPSLRGVWDTAPYLHDGSAATLLDVITTRNPVDQHGVTSTLSADQRSDLITYLLSIDGSPVDEPTDDDSDGLSDQWEILHGLNPASRADAAADPDGDGNSNLHEFAAGTDPRDSASRLFIRENNLAGSEWTITFPTVRGRNYFIERSATLAPGGWVPFQSLPGDGAEHASGNNVSSSREFWRVTVTR